MTSVGDNPIIESKQDSLGRAALAQTLAREIRHVDSSEGYVFSIIGPWGSGKTSLLNLTRLALAKDPAFTVVTFNPWMFAGTEQLVEAFFHELSSQLKESNADKFGKIATTVDTYANLFSPLTLLPWFGAWYGRFLKVSKAARDYGESKKSSVNAKRAELRKQLEDLDQPIVIVIDDIDRLNSAEIKSVFKLVRLTGNFPNLVYILAFDRVRVEDALQDTGIDGRAYLEKIVQQGVRIPEISKVDLINKLVEALTDAASDVDEYAYFNQDYWLDVLAEIVAPLVETMRDVRRYAAAFGTVARDLGQEIEVTDLLALEAVKVFLPDSFDRIVSARKALTSHRDSRDDGFGSQIKALVGDKEPDRTVLSALVSRVFPLAAGYVGGTNYDRSFLSTWLRQRRVAHPDIFSLYLERSRPHELDDFIDAEKAYALLNDEVALDSFLRGVDAERLDSVIASLQHFENDFDHNAVVPATTVLLNIMNQLPRTTTPSFFGNETRVRAIVWRFLQKLDDPAKATEAIDLIMPRLDSLSSKFLLINMVGHREDTGHNLVTEEEATRLEGEIVEQIVAATPEQLVKEWDILRLLSTPIYWGLRDAPALSDYSVPELHRKVLLRSQSDVVSQTMGNRATHIARRLHWDTLERIYANEGNISKAVEAAESTLTENDEVKAVVELAKKYLSGWRPERF